ncbi:MAG: AbrB/MazE/SpoVT family DNA-binding domain-containing protein [Candidatus Helarchaeota archaeon]|nr:AbrB/MazE/SpoVT family DNA-binding domain-containing protein [Candidatus Helarchaeota archaeon]
MEKFEKHHSKGEALENGKYHYGKVKCGESYQIVIPKQAREHFGIKAGDKLLVLGDIKKGIAIQKASIMKNLALKILSVIGGTLLKNRSEPERDA